MIRFPLFIFLMLIYGCSPADNAEIPDFIKELENITVFSSNEEPPFEIKINRELSYSNSDELITGTTGSFDLDEKGSIYIIDRQLKRIHQYDSNGKYILEFAREGSGPGEFRFPGRLSVNGDQLSVYDPALFRVNFFSADSLKFIESFKLQPRNKKDFKKLDGQNVSYISVISDSLFLTGFSDPLYPDPSHQNYNLNTRTISYYLMTRNGHIISAPVFEQPAYRALSAVVQGQYRFTQFEFLGKTLITASENSQLYMAQTDHFFIRVYDAHGRYLHGIYYPYNKSVFTREEAIQIETVDFEEGVTDWRVSVIRYSADEDIPETWPALNNMLVDDENRLWVSTIVSDRDVYEWWVLQDTGELIAKFLWPRHKEIEVVKSGKIYVRETEEETGLQQVVRYGFELISKH